MKLAIPVNSNSTDTTVCPSFGRTPYFLIYDIAKRESSFLDNSAAASQGGAGIKAAQIIVDSAVKALLTPRCGENAATVIKEANINIYKTMNDSVLDNIEAFIKGELPILEEIHAGFHNHGGK